MGDHQDVAVARLAAVTSAQPAERGQVVSRFDFGEPETGKISIDHVLSAVADGFDDDFGQPGGGREIGHPGVGHVNPWSS